jgi:hypothetical protein
MSRRRVFSLRTNKALCERSTDLTKQWARPCSTGAPLTTIDSNFGTMQNTATAATSAQQA